MKIAIPILSALVSPTDITIWLKAYKKYNIDIPCVLICDKISKNIQESWPFEIIESAINNTVLLDPINNGINSLNVAMINIIQKLNCFSLVGPCLVLEPYSIFVKSVKINDIPECDFGLIKKIEFSKYFQETKAWWSYFNHLSSPNFLERVETHTMILRNDYSIFYATEYYKNLNKIKELELNYPELILALTHKTQNGVYISEDWGWPNDSLIRNKTRLIDYYNTTRRHLLTFSHFNDLTITFNKEKIVGTIND